MYLTDIKSPIITLRIQSVPLSQRVDIIDKVSSGILSVTYL